MIPVNPGNLLVFYDKKRWQRHRQTGTDVLPYGMPCPNTRLMPWQIWFPDGILGTVYWALVNASDEGDVTVLDPDLLTVTAKDGGGDWLTWDASVDLDVYMPCGYYYIQVYIGETGYFSEVLYLKYYGALETAKIEISDCAVDGTDISFTLTGTFSAANPDDATAGIDRYNAGWSTLVNAATTSVVEVLASETRQYRFVVQTAYGNTITVTYTATWDAGAPDPCATLVLTLDSIVVFNTDPANSPAQYRVEFSNTKDKYNVLWQDGYTQYMYIPEPVWDVPVVERTTETSVNGSGNETTRYSRTAERKRFEFADVPDWALGFLAKCGDLDTVAFSDIVVPDSFTMANVQFETRRQGAALNIGALSFDAEIETFAGCLEDYTLA